MACLCLLVLLACVSVAGCGEDGPAETPRSDVGVALEGPRKCLTMLGASQARKPSDIAFHIRESRKRDTVNPGSAENGTVQINEFRPVVAGSSSKDPLPSYILWVGEPLGEGESDPVTALEEPRPDILVMYLRDPDRRSMGGAKRCMDTLGGSALDGLAQ
jgi:hypothetical protein